MSSPFLWAHQMEMQQQRESVEEKLNWFFFRFDKMSKALNPVDGGRRRRRHPLERAAWDYEQRRALTAKVKDGKTEGKEITQCGKRRKRRERDETRRQGNAPIVDSFPR